MADTEKTPSGQEDNPEPTMPTESTEIEKKDDLVKEDDLNSEHHVTGWKLAVITVCLLMAMFLVALV